MDGRYIIDDDGGAIRTTNFLVDVDARGNATNPRNLLEPAGRTSSSFPVHGYEDVRLAPVGDELWALATVRDSDESGLCRIALLRLADDGRVVEERIVVGPTPGRHEKNWAPFAAEGISSGASVGEVTVVYSWDPLVIAAISPDPDSPTEARFRELSRTASGLGPNVRGGTNGVRVEGGWLFLVHESRRFPDSVARYLHRFVIVREDATVGLVSPLLTFLTDGVEFALGAAHQGDDLLVAFGLDDAEAWIARMSFDRVIERLASPAGSENPS